MDYREYFSKERKQPEKSTDPPEKSVDQPRIDYSIITWLRQIYPIRRYSKKEIGDSNFNLLVACDEGRYELIDRIEAEFNRQYEIRKADKEI